MNFRQYKYLLTLAEKGSFSRAAEELGVSQPSLSQYVKRVETENAVSLFERTNGEVRLTDAGRVYLDAARRILEIERQMQGAFNDLAEHKTGSVVVGTSPYRSAVMMPSIVKKFRERYPGMHIVVEEMTTQDLLEASQRGQFDVCLTMLPVDEQPFSYERIAEEELVLAVPKDFPPISSRQIAGRKYPSIDAKNADGLPFVMITEGQWMQKALDKLSSEYGLSLKKVAVVKSLEAQIAMVRAGIGAALVPGGIDRFCPSEEVRYYSFKQQLPKREVVVLWRREQHLNGVTKELLRMMKEINW